MKKVVINDVCFGGESLGLILGPCVIESESFALETADMILAELKEFESSLNIFFKSSFDNPCLLKNIISKNKTN